jgi:hypothetical protein
VPFGPWKEYQERVASVEEIKEKWLALPTGNVGLALGPVSGVVRIDAEGAQAVDLLNGLSKGDLPPTLEFKSGRVDGSGRGWLYGIPADAALKTTYEGYGAHQELRFQAKGAQTVLPPSRHRDGNLYEWLPGLGPGQVGLATMPEWLVAELSVGASVRNGKNDKDKDWGDLFSGVEEGRRNATAASIVGKLLYNLRDLNDWKTTWLAVQAWNEQNDPPMTDDELKAVFKSLLKKESERREKEDQGSLERLIERQINDSAETTVPESNGVAANGQVAPLPDWHLIIANKQPTPEYLLRSPFWSRRAKVAGNGGYITLTLDQISDWTSLRKAAIAQAECSPPMKIKKWAALLQTLLDNPGRQEAPLEDKKPLVTAEFLWENLSSAKPVGMEEDGVTPRYGKGAPKRLGDGRIIVKSKWLVQQASFLADGPKRKEITEAMVHYGMKPQQFGTKASRSRWWTIEQNNLDLLGNDVNGP